MSKVLITVTVNERVFETEVDRKELAEKLQFSNRVAKARGMRPGEPINLTHTSSDPISHEKAYTLSQVIKTLEKENL